jgi:hypothetical protein
MSANCGLRIYRWLEKKRIFSREIIFDTAIFLKNFSARFDLFAETSEQEH